MSNSSLVSYRNITSHKDSPRKQPIRKITIHHMAGFMTAKECADYFARTDREVSSNYCIGSDGKIAMSVEEKDRSWCSSSGENDHQAITIEVANIKGAPNWEVSDKALASLINLCIDICKRNSIKSLNYTGNKNGNLTLHEMFANTNCPGPYLKSKIPYIVSKVNTALKSTETTQIGEIKSPVKSIDELAKEVIAGKYGNGEARKRALGSSYYAVQKRVNELLNQKVPVKTPTTKGSAVKLTNKALYASSTATNAVRKITGTYYIYDGQKINGRYRITNSVSNVGKSPAGVFVTGWVSL